MRGSLVMPTGNHALDSNSSSNRASLSRRGTTNPSSAVKEPKGFTTVRARRPSVLIGSHTLFGTVDGTLGAILGIDRRTFAFFSTLERAMARVVIPVGQFWHDQYRAFQTDQRTHPHHGFVDGDLVESFLDLDRGSMESIVAEMNRDGGWDLDDFGQSMHEDDSNRKVADDEMSLDAKSTAALSVEDVLAMVEEMTMQH